MCRLSCSPPNQTHLTSWPAWKPGPTTTCPSPSKWPNCWREDGATGGASGGNANVNHLERGSIVIDRLEHTATKDGKDLNLTPMEFELLFMLAAAAGEAISRSSLLKNVWGYENSGDTRLVNVHVQRLRAKVEDDPENPQIVQTVRGIGYKFVTPEQ